MFLICQKGGHRHWCNDIDTAADIVYGITGDYEDYERVATIMGNMKFNDHFKTKDVNIWCYLEEEDDLEKFIKSLPRYTDEQWKYILERFEDLLTNEKRGKFE